MFIVIRYLQYHLPKHLVHDVPWRKYRCCPSLAPSKQQSATSVVTTATDVLLQLLSSTKQVVRLSDNEVATQTIETHITTNVCQSNLGCRTGIQ